MTNEEYIKLTKRTEVLTERYQELMVMEQTPTIQDIIGEYMEEAERINKILSEKREYLYNFVDGGWNSEYAYTRELAIKQAKARWENTCMQADPATFRVSTPTDYQNLLSLFY